MFYSYSLCGQTWLKTCKTWAPSIFCCLCHTIHHSISMCDALDCSSIILMCCSFLSYLIVRFLSTGILPYVFLTSLRSSWQNVFIFLRFLLLCFILPSCHYWMLRLSISPFPGSLCQTLPSSSESTWHQACKAHVSFVPHCLLSWIFMVIPYFSYYYYEILRFLKGAIIYYPIICFSVLSNKISELFIQGLKTNTCFLTFL